MEPPRQSLSVKIWLCFGSTPAAGPGSTMRCLLAHAVSEGTDCLWEERLGRRRSPTREKTKPSASEGRKGKQRRSCRRLSKDAWLLDVCNFVFPHTFAATATDELTSCCHPRRIPPRRRRVTKKRKENQVPDCVVEVWPRHTCSRRHNVSR